jgi:hypothetical protein
MCLFNYILALGLQYKTVKFECHVATSKVSNEVHHEEGHQASIYAVGVEMTSSLVCVTNW